MKPKELVANYYKSDVILNSQAVNEFLHPEMILEWNSSKGYLKLDKKQLLDFSTELSKAYVRVKYDIKHLIAKEETVIVRFTQYAKTIENPHEEMFIANFMVIWEMKDNKLYRGYQMSQL